MKLKDLIGPDVSAPDNASELDVAGLTADSRAVEPSFVFAALAGVKADGSQFIADAIARGAVAVLVAADAKISSSVDVPVLRAGEPRLALAQMASRFYSDQPETIVAITGTSGKTSVADFTRQIFSSLGWTSASLGTIGVVKPDGAVYGSLTTPDPVTLHQTLAQLAAEGVTHVALEASSHGLDQYRMDGVHLKAGAFTNLGRDHLDYHPTIEDYMAAKMRLFNSLLEAGQPAVINLDAPYAKQALRTAVANDLELITVGEAGETITLTEVSREGFVQHLKVVYDDQVYPIRFPLVGTYQIANALAAAGLAIAVGGAPMDVFFALQNLSGVPGRLEIIGECRGGLVVVDYAHKPEALAAALDAVRPFVTGRLICVFGCGGDRDKGKRPLMGEIAVAKADVVIVTDDNPRTEDATSIRSEILAAAIGAKEVGDRREAIQTSIADISKGDVVLIAGKGHETGQIVGDTVLPFSDHEEARTAMAAVEQTNPNSKN
ncbi:MAG: UDP-N-acetylmuramoyl-L-alanyl-D-glutamate--2,6-diaminopimelate ligase [Hyphomicrobiaceae bacterium]